MLGSAGNVMEAKSGKLYFWGHSKVRRKRKFLYPSHLVISTYDTYLPNISLFIQIQSREFQELKVTSNIINVSQNVFSPTIKFVKYPLM